MRLALIMLFSLAACGSEYSDYIPGKLKNNHKPVTVNSEFKPFISKFKKLYGLSFHIRVEFSKLEQPMIGVCYYWDDGHREIEIDREAWPTLSKHEKEELIFHELGHCILNRDHVDERGQVGDYLNAPLSIMYPYVFGDQYYYRNNLDHYYNELIKHRQ